MMLTRPESGVITPRVIVLPSKPVSFGGVFAPAPAPAEPASATTMPAESATATIERSVRVRMLPPLPPERLYRRSGIPTASAVFLPRQRPRAEVSRNAPHQSCHAVRLRHEEHDDEPDIHQRLEAPLRDACS